MIAIGLKFAETPMSHLSLLRKNCLELPRLKAPPMLDEVRFAARQAWENRVRAEYQGVMVSRRFHSLLVELNAPMDLQELALKITLQEQQHARYCAAAAASLGSDGKLIMDLGKLMMYRPGIPPEQEFWELVCGPFAVDEVVASKVLAHAVRTLPLSAYRKILQTILADEWLPARLGFLILQSARTRQAPDWIDPPEEDWIKGYSGRYLRTLQLKLSGDPDESRLFEHAEHRESLMKVGVPPTEEFKAARAAALEKEVPARFKALGIAL